MNYLDYINEKFPARRTGEQKGAFRTYVVERFSKKSVRAEVERTKDGKNDNVVIGDPESAKVVFIAHYDTPAATLFPNLMMPRSKVLFYLYQLIPVAFLLAVSFAAEIISSVVFGATYEVSFIVFIVAYYLTFYLTFFTFTNKNNYNDNTSGVATVLTIAERCAEEGLTGAAFILFDNEEKGKKGSKAYFRDHRIFMSEKTVINFDCVGNGDNIIFVLPKGEENIPELAQLREAFNDGADYSVGFYPARGSECNSDHKSFPRGVACMAAKRSRCGIYYTARIHTKFDTVASVANVEFLSERAFSFIKRCEDLEDREYKIIGNAEIIEKRI